MLVKKFLKCHNILGSEVKNDTSTTLTNSDVCVSSRNPFESFLSVVKVFHQFEACFFFWVF